MNAANIAEQTQPDVFYFFTMVVLILISAWTTNEVFSCIEITIGYFNTLILTQEQSLNIVRQIVEVFMICRQVRHLKWKLFWKTPNFSYWYAYWFLIYTKRNTGRKNMQIGLDKSRQKETYRCGYDKSCYNYTLVFYLI